MKNKVAVLDADKVQRTEVCRLLQNHQWKAIEFETFNEMQNNGEISQYSAVIINLDNISVGNKGLRKLKMKNVRLHIIGLSMRPFHPDLEEAFREHISVCIDHPVDPDELVYWLKIFDP